MTKDILVDGVKPVSTTTVLESTVDVKKIQVTITQVDTINPPKNGPFAGVLQAIEDISNLFNSFMKYMETAISNLFSKEASKKEEKRKLIGEDDSQFEVVLEDGVCSTSEATIFTTEEPSEDLKTYTKDLEAFGIVLKDLNDRIQKAKTNSANKYAIDMPKMDCGNSPTLESLLEGDATPEELYVAIVKFHQKAKEPQQNKTFWNGILAFLIAVQGKLEEDRLNVVGLDGDLEDSSIEKQCNGVQASAESILKVLSEECKLNVKDYQDHRTAMIDI
jgi:hypothetical protein